jgi:hypothetical protein
MLPFVENLWHPDAQLENGKWVCWVQYIDLVWEAGWMQSHGWKALYSVGVCLTKFEAPNEEAAKAYNHERAMREYNSVPSI